MRNAMSKWMPAVVGLMAVPVIALTVNLPLEYYQVCRACNADGSLCSFRVCHYDQSCGKQSGIDEDGEWVRAVCRSNLEPANP